MVSAFVLLNSSYVATANDTDTVNNDVSDTEVLQKGKKHPYARQNRGENTNAQKKIKGKQKAIERRLKGKEKAIERQQAGKEKTIQKKLDRKEKKLEKNIGEAKKKHLKRKKTTEN